MLPPMTGTRVEIASRIAAARTSGLASGTILFKENVLYIKIKGASIISGLDIGVSDPPLSRTVESPGKHRIRSWASL